MKKFIKIGFIMLIAGGIITGCGTKIESDDLKEVKNAEQLIVETRAVEEQQPLIVDESKFLTYLFIKSKQQNIHI